MLDPSLTVSFALQSAKGAYAVLLGSGVSRSAGVPTGWEIVLDLIRKLAGLQNARCEPDPAAWYRSTYQSPPDYSELLHSLANTPAERLQMLRGYFEPDDADREEGRKVPGPAHRAIARLVAAGYIRVVLTTNFDRLIEQALVEEGVASTVISTPDGAEGAIPLVHQSAVVIKLHGDYLDERIKNTLDELANYDPRMSNLLDRVFDEFGLVVCGWSAEWDTALRSALQRCKTHRFSTYWVARGEVKKAALDLIALRRAQIVKAKNADEFFGLLADRVFTLAEFDRPHPLSLQVAVATTKRYLSSAEFTIRLHDLVMDEAECIREVVGTDDAGTPLVTGEATLDRLQHYESLCETIMSLLSIGCYWGEATHAPIWVKCLRRLANPPEVTGMHYFAWESLRLYPALLCLYAGGIAALAASRYDTFRALLLEPLVRKASSEKSLVIGLYPYEVLEPGLCKKIPGWERLYTPFHEHLFSVLREPLREPIPDDSEYNELFDRFEYLFALVHADSTSDGDRGPIWGPPGRFAWKLRHGDEHAFYEKLATEAQQSGDEWAALRSGLFRGSLQRFFEIRARYENEFLKKVSFG